MNAQLPDGIEPFLNQAGWAGAQIDALPGDASFRRYFRVTKPGKSAMLMDAPPPNEDPVHTCVQPSGSMPTVCARLIFTPKTPRADWS